MENNQEGDKRWKKEVFAKIVKEARSYKRILGITKKKRKYWRRKILQRMMSPSWMTKNDQDKERNSWMMKNDQVGRWKKEELVEWNEDIIIQVQILMLEASKIIWKLEWLNSELKSAKMRFWMRKLEFPSQNSSFMLCYSGLLFWYDKTRVRNSKLEFWCLQQLWGLWTRSKLEFPSQNSSFQRWSAQFHVQHGRRLVIRWYLLGQTSDWGEISGIWN